MQWPWYNLIGGRTIRDGANGECALSFDPRMRLGIFSFIQFPPTLLVSLSISLPRQVRPHRVTPNPKRPLKADDLAGEELP